MCTCRCVSAGARGEEARVGHQMCSLATLHLIFEQSLSLLEPGAPQLGYTGQSEGSKNPLVSSFPELELSMCTTCLSFYVGLEHPNSVPPACRAIPLPTEPLLQPLLLTSSQQVLLGSGVEKPGWSSRAGWTV